MCLCSLELSFQPAGLIQFERVSHRTDHSIQTHNRPNNQSPEGDRLTGDRDYSFGLDTSEPGELMRLTEQANIRILQRLQQAMLTL